MALSTTLLTRRAMRAQRLLRVPSEVQRLAPISPISSFASRSYSAPPPNSRDKGEQVIYDKLSARFPGKTLEVQDVSGGCGSFYAIEISSPVFKGLSMIKQHKLVNECLKEDIKDIHGLQLKTIPESDTKTD